MKLHEDKDAFQEFVQLTAQFMRVPESYVEKDYWVTRALKNLSVPEMSRHIVFKGGTSLSKAYGMINRFSEDIDLAICFGTVTGAQIKKSISKAEALVAGDLVEVLDDIRISKGSQFRKVVYQYPSVFDQEGMGQVGRHILIETNSFTTPEPAEPRPICALIAQALLEKGRAELVEQYELVEFQVMVLCVERTLVEKIFGLVRASQEQDYAHALKQKIRHVYDVCMMLRHERIKGFLDTEQFLEMVEIVADTDRRQFKGSCTWLLEPLHAACLFAEAERVWGEIAEEFYGSFKDMLYDDDIPDQDEVIQVLQRLGKCLERFHVETSTKASC
ncbi:nucleotidyl transferase AbiEii/AbiGii toxin family protein [Pseudomonas sp. MWU13-3659]|uniref:nucleotidyl transferase AbiEii/AbiGii toxin family protein n=1 Tax=Pseudomonas sp. MWU13-3659 TaxID=2986964 RepID=UPI00207566D1|nr:nucleotidyl transferase AbiEii/AbiGii toxin family protein [Pseudomonas sp. MWU13-3659]